MEKEVTNGLRELPYDPRDLPLGAIFDLPKLDELPAEFIIGTPKIKNQMESDFCGGFSSCSVSELHEDVELSPEWVFAVAKMIEGDPDSFGIDLRTICKVHQKYGAIETADAPYSLEKGQSVDFLRRIENWPKKLFEKALVHRKASYFAIKGQYDNFDNIRATMWKFRKEKCGVIFGVMWSWPISQVTMQSVGNGGGHALAQIGWVTDKNSGEPLMFIQNSYGKEAGDKGRHYFSRDVVNTFVDKYGAFMFHDLSAETAKHYLENGIKYGDNWVTQLLKSFGIWKFFTDLITAMFSKRIE